MTFWEVVESLQATPSAPGEWWGRLDGEAWGWVRVRAGRTSGAAFGAGVHRAVRRRERESAGIGLFAESPYNPNLHSLDLFQWDPSVDPLPYPMAA